MPKPNDKRKSGKRAARRLRLYGPEESRPVEFLTVTWMLTVFTTLICELSAVGATWYFRIDPQATRMLVLASILIFAALVIGLLSLVLMALVWKLRTTRPPNGISVFALVVGAAPALLFVLRKLLA